MHISRFSLPSSTNSIISKSIRLFAFFRQEHDMENSRNSIHHLKITEWSLLVNKRNQKRHLNIQVSAWRGRQVTRLLSANAWQKETVKEGRGRQEGGGRKRRRRRRRRKSRTREAQQTGRGRRSKFTAEWAKCREKERVVQNNPGLLTPGQIFQLIKNGRSTNKFA